MADDLPTGPGCQNEMTSSAASLWARILAVDVRSHEYFAERTDWPGSALFTNAGAPPFNLAVIGEVPEDTASELLGRIIAHYHGLGLACRVRLTPVSRPASWAARLAAHGFRHLEDEDEEFMVARSPLHADHMRGADVRSVAEEAGLAEFVRVQQAGWGMAADEDGRALRLARRALAAGLYRYYIAYLDGQPAGAASARFADGLVGIYGVATLAELRRRGVGGTLVARIVEEGKREGCGTAFLSAEPGGYPAGLYRKMGFVPIFLVRNYVLPAPSADPGSDAVV